MTNEEFFLAMWPYYLSLGCSYNEYWNAPAHVAASYYEAETYCKERANYEAWLQGLYFSRAVNSALALAFWNHKGKRPDGYIQYPIAFTENEIAAEKERKRQESLQWFLKGQNQ